MNPNDAAISDWLRSRIEEIGPENLEVRGFTDDPDKFVFENTLVPWDVVPEDMREKMKAFLSRYSAAPAPKPVGRTDTNVDKRSPDSRYADLGSVPEFQEDEILPPPTSPKKPKAEKADADLETEEVEVELNSEEEAISTNGTEPTAVHHTVPRPVGRSPTAPPNGDIQPPELITDPPEPLSTPTGPTLMPEQFPAGLKNGPEQLAVPRPRSRTWLAEPGEEEPEESPTTGSRHTPPEPPKAQPPPPPVAMPRREAQGIKAATGVAAGRKREGDAKPPPPPAASASSGPNKNPDQVTTEKNIRPPGTVPVTADTDRWYRNENTQNLGDAPLKKFAKGIIFLVCVAIVLVACGMLYNFAKPLLVSDGQPEAVVILAPPPETLAVKAILTLDAPYQTGNGLACVTGALDGVEFSRAGTEHIAVCGPALKTGSNGVMLGETEIPLPSILEGMRGQTGPEIQDFTLMGATVYCRTSLGPVNGQPPCTKK